MCVRKIYCKFITSKFSYSLNIRSLSDACSLSGLLLGSLLGSDLVPDGSALQYASEELKTDPGFVLSTV